MPFFNHLPELMIALVLGLLIFGPKRLPEMGNSVAKTIREFQRSMKEISSSHDQPATPVALPPVTNEATPVE